MLNSRSKAVLVSLLCAAMLALTACGTNEEPADIQTASPATTITASVPKTEATTEKPETTPEETKAPELILYYGCGESFRSCFFVVLVNQQPLGS